MARFLETFNIVEGDGDWTKGRYPIDTLACGFLIDTYDICSPGAVPDPPSFESGREVHPFAIKGYIKIPTRCEPADVESYARKVFLDTTEHAVTHALWNGPNDFDGELFLKSDLVEEVPRTGDMNSILGAVLYRAYEKVPHIRPVIHLGFQSAMSLQFGLNNLNLPYIVAPAYPPDAVAVTDSVTVRLGSIESQTKVNPALNRKEVEVTRLAAIEFDPCLAVRAADSV